MFFCFFGVLPTPDGQSQDILRPDRLWWECRSGGRVSPSMVKGRQPRELPAQTSELLLVLIVGGVCRVGYCCGTALEGM